VSWHIIYVLCRNTIFTGTWAVTQLLPCHFECLCVTPPSVSDSQLYYYFSLTFTVCLSHICLSLSHFSLSFTSKEPPPFPPHSLTTASLSIFDCIPFCWGHRVCDVWCLCVCRQFYKVCELSVFFNREEKLFEIQ